jgi:hypothetical protein
LANRTIAHVLASLAVVIIKQKCINAHTTVIAMAKVLAPTDTTEATIVAVVRRFTRCHPQVTNVAVVLAKLNITVDAVVAADRGRTN